MISRIISNIFKRKYFREIIAILFFIFLSCNVLAQVIDTVDYFPLNFGNMYHYYHTGDCPPSSIRYFFSIGWVKYNDTVIINEKKYFCITRLYWGLDTVRKDEAGNLLYHYKDNDEIFYKINASEGEQWQCTLPGTDYQPGTVTLTMKSRNDTVITHAGIFTNCLRIGFRGPGAFDSKTHWLAPNIGLIAQCLDEPDILYEAILKGVNYPITNISNVRNPINSFNIFQNYPNPFNPTTIIKYTIKENSTVTLKVYDVLGREVSTLINGNKESGSYSVSFDGKNLSSGIYFYRLEAIPNNGGNKVTIQKSMMLMK
jgi:hypothetical protein